ncbi:hypothetical protein LPTSP3_g27560 [Leptospira kobayashii]|uniref:Uncharacterized protein n=1 Tax=Leptospira kobayashii TaxID=1917830 RepID=A0ABM7ULH7_9LEPT|nr:hypothetical protein [Leptospira kobayashii]BDA79826.1 hypothetical protein LPTSP3_g27560 [Leptospira kobayashii]
MDLYRINLKKFHLLYFVYFLLSGLVSIPLLGLWVDKNLHFVFYLGAGISFFLQIAAMELRFLPRVSPGLGEKGFPFFTVILFFFVNLGTISALAFLEFPFESIAGFLIAYFLHLLFLVFASYYSEK